MAVQTGDRGAPGYVWQEKYDTKASRRQLDQLLCGRCQALSNGAMIPGVEDFAQKVQQAQQAADTEAEAGAGGGAALEGAVVSGAGFGGSKRLLTPEQLRDSLK